MAWFESELVAVFKRNGGLVCNGICTEAGVRGIYPAFEGGNQTIAPSSNQRYFEALWVIPMKILLSLINLAAMADIVIALALPKANPDRQPEHYDNYAQKNDFEIQSDQYYRRLEQERLRQQLLEQQRIERIRLKQPHLERQSETNSQRMNQQRLDQLHIQRQQLELQLNNQRIQNEMEQERQNQMIKEFYH
ncbi:MAG: hypothetical protein ACR65R_08355 [Methylomicrobium sp.]